MKHRLGILGGCSLAAGLPLTLALTAPPASAGPDPGVRSAYWWIAEQGPLPPPAPPQVPAGGLYVASTPGGATAVSAVHLQLAPGTAAVLHLRPVMTTGTPSVLVCPVTAIIPQGTGPNAWDDRPSPTCPAAPVQAGPGGTDAVPTLDVRLDSLLSASGAIDVELLPGVDPATGQAAGFDLALAPLTAASVELLPAGGGAASAAPASVAPPGPSSSAAARPVAPRRTASASASASATAAAPAPATTGGTTVGPPAVAAAPVAIPAPGVQPVASAPSEAAAPAPLLPGPSATPETSAPVVAAATGVPAERPPALAADGSTGSAGQHPGRALALALGGVLLALLWAGPLRGRLATGPVQERGIGRFRRERNTPPSPW